MNIVIQTQLLISHIHYQNIFSNIFHQSYYRKCNNTKLFTYCQNHYLSLWNASANQIVTYKKGIVNSKLIYSFHTSLSHINRVYDLLINWKGAIIIALFIKRSEMNLLHKHMIEFKNHNLYIILYAVDDIQQHILYDNCIYYKDGECSYEKEYIYPINTLRNLIINCARGYIIDADADVIPSPNTYHILSKIQIDYDDKTVFILPLFQYTKQYRNRCHNASCYEELMNNRPRNISELKECINNRKCQIANAHLRTRRVVNHDWWVESNPIQELSCFPFGIMEPYIMIKACNTTVLYDERFVNYGYNKVQHIYHLHHNGYTFHVLTHTFAFDAPHAPSNISYQFEGNKQYFTRLIWNEFKRTHKNIPLKQKLCNEQLALKYFPTYT